MSSLSPPPPPPPRRSPARLVALATVLLVFVPLVIQVGPAELARWKYAAAESAYEAGHVQHAITLISEALRRAPDDIAMLLRRADWWQEVEEPDKAFQDLQRAGEVANGPERIGMLIERAELLQEMQRWQEAVKDWKEVEKLADDEPRLYPKDMILNGLAYARALANTELDEAYLDVQESIRLAASPANLDTRGYILYLRGNPLAAKEDLTDAIEGMEKELAAWEKQSPQLRRQLIDLKPLEERDEQLRRSLAVMLYHRALVYEKLEPELAEQDYAAIRKHINREPGPWLF